jgi:BarA-like signal transduction histidine kinase
LFRLNRRVVTSIGAHQTVRYEMLLTIPATMKPGLTMHVNWLLRTLWLAAGVNPTNGFIITIK